MSKSLADILNLRFQYESLVTAQRPFNLKSHNSDIDSLIYFINTGHKSNRFRKNYKQAFDIAKEIVDYYDRPVESYSYELER